MTKEQTFFMIKPDGVRYLPNIFKMMRENQLHIESHHMIDKAPIEILREHYAHIADKPFFPDVVSYMQSGPVIIGTLTAENAVQKWRDLMGVTNPKDAKEGTIRQKFGKIKRGQILNVVHGSDSLENAVKEKDLWFRLLDNRYQK